MNIDYAREAVLERDIAYMYARRAEMAGEDNPDHTYYTEKSEDAFKEASKLATYAAMFPTK